MNAKLPVDVSGLKGLHVPKTTDIFPLAIGWWLVIILFVFLLISLYFAFSAWFYSLKRQVARKIRKIEKITNNKKMLKELNQLAKRVAIAQFGRDKVARLYENEWVDFMNKTSKREIFSKDYIDLLHKSMYADKENVSDMERQRILKDYEKWFQIIFKK